MSPLIEYIPVGVLIWIFTIIGVMAPTRRECRPNRKKGENE